MPQNYVSLLRNYQHLEPRDREAVRDWLTGARYQEFAVLLGCPETAAPLARARAGDEDLRRAFEQQARNNTLAMSLLALPFALAVSLAFL